MNTFDRLSDRFAGFLKTVQEQIELSIHDFDQERVRELLTYQARTRGHMLRPLMVALVAHAICGKDFPRKAEPLSAMAASIELLHNASLVHDDMLDEAEFRRGEACVHRVYGFRNALLTGNLLYIKSIELCTQRLGSAQVADLLHTALEMCQGEILQEQYIGKSLPDDVYFEIIRQKTSSLISLACRQAAVLAGASQEDVQRYSALGESLGILYQLRDDFQDQDILLGADFDFAQVIEAHCDRIAVLLDSLPEQHDKVGFLGLLAFFKAVNKSNKG